MWYFFSFYLPISLVEFLQINLQKWASSKCEQVCKIAESQVHVG